MKSILLGLNELNFDFINFYIKKGQLNNFKSLFESYQCVETVSEDKFELLEPWIQWVTVHSGQTFHEHQIFRLGDITNYSGDQIFEYLESKGLKIGAVSPFNAKNSLKNPAFFIPDPWTKTKVSGNWFIKALYQAVHQSVNDNASGKLSLKSICSLGLGSLIFIPFKHYKLYFKYFLNRKKPGYKAIILDALLGDAFLYLFRNKKPDFSTLFLNSGAHIQHHYLFNSSAYAGEFENPDWYCKKGYDPLLEVLKHYDYILGEMLSEKVNLFICTGLHQQPHDELTFHWRIKNHLDFIKMLNLKGFKQITPRMSIDFLVEFDNKKNALSAEKILNSFSMKRDRNKIFNIDNRGDSLFVELIYFKEIHGTDEILSDEFNIAIKNFKSLVSFNAIKNGEHNGVGYFVFKKENVYQKIDNKIQLKKVRGIIEQSVLQNI